MTTTGPTQPGLEARSNETSEAAIENIASLRNILEDIIQKLNHQVLGNCQTLIHMEAISARSDKLVIGENGETQTLKVFQSDQINSLLKNPIRLSLGRLKGLQKVLDQLESQVLTKK